MRTNFEWLRVCPLARLVEWNNFEKREIYYTVRGYGDVEKEV